MNTLELGHKIRQFRQKAGLSQMQLELEINAAPGSLSRIESGKINPTKETLNKIIDILSLNSLEAASLFNIDTSRELISMVEASQALSSLELSKTLQAAVNEVVYKLNLLSGFIALIKGDQLYAEAIAENYITHLAAKMIGFPISLLHVSLETDNDNLMIKSVKEQKIFVSKDLEDFIVPAVSLPLAKVLRKVSNAQSAISLPLIYGNKCIGAVMFNKNYVDDFSHEKKILEAFCNQIAIAINNAQEYQRVREELEFFKNQNRLNND